MNPSLFIYDDPADLPNFLPFTASRPIGELRHGACFLRERVAAALGAGKPPAGYLAPPHLSQFSEAGAPAVVPAPPAEGVRIMLRSSFVPAPAQNFAMGYTPGTAGVRLTSPDGASVGCVLAARTPWKGPASEPDDWPEVKLEGRLLGGAWDLVRDLVPVLTSDLVELARSRGPGRVPAGCSVIGDPAQVICEGAQIEPLVVFDVRNGPVVLEPGVEVRSFSRLQGPLYVGTGTRIVGGQLRESSIGPRCVVHGEVSNCLFLGYGNKSHDGFLGHSIIGRWVNLGAGTITSNLKNTYGPVRLNLGPKRVDTGMTFLGALIGDHAKTAIGTMLPTGCVVGAGANLFGTRRPEGYVPAFAWGTEEPGRVVACRMFLQVAERAMPRRDVPFDDAARRHLVAVWEAATGQKCD